MALTNLAALEDIPLQVLLIDDDEDAFVLTRDILDDVQRQRYVLEWARSAVEGIAMAEGRNFDVCLVDFYLGEHTGDAVIAELRRRKSLIPMILLTGEDRIANDISVMSAGADDYLVKGSVNAVVLERAIRFAVQRRTQEADLRTSEERFRELFQSSMDAVLVTAPNGDVLEANPAAEELFRLSSAELMARGRLSLIAAEDHAVAEALDARVQAGSFREEMLLRRGDGTTFMGEVSLAGSLAESPEGTGGRGSMVIRDVSARRATEQRHVDSDARFRRVERIWPLGAVAAISLMVVASLILSPWYGVAIAAIGIGFQAWMVRGLATQRTRAVSSLAEWREQAAEARKGLSRFALHVRIDPESGLNTRKVMQRSFDQRIARFERTGEVFALALIEVADPESPRREPPGPVVQAVSQVLMGGATPEDTAGRIDVNTFAILLAGHSKESASDFIEQFRGHLGNKLRGTPGTIRVLGGFADVSVRSKSLDELINDATDDMHNFNRELAMQVAHISTDRQVRWQSE